MGSCVSLTWPGPGNYPRAVPALLPGVRVVGGGQFAGALGDDAGTAALGGKKKHDSIKEARQKLCIIKCKIRGIPN